MSLAVPVMLASISTPLVGAVDTALLGHLADPALIGGVAAASVVINFVFYALNFLRSSTTAMVAQAIGARDATESLATALRACILALGFGALAVLLQVPIVWSGFTLLGIDGEVRAAGEAYLHIRIWSAPMMLLNYCLAGWLIGQGAVVKALLLQLLLNLLNMGLCILFVWQLEWGVEGTALGAALAETITALAGAILLMRAMRGRWSTVLPALPDLEQVRRMIMVNTDILIRSFLLIGVIAMFTRQGAGFDTVTLAANVILMNLFYLSGAVMDGIATASQQLSGRFIGARDRASLERTVRLALMWSVCFSVTLVLVLFASRDAIVAVMTSSADVQQAAFAYYGWAALTPVFGSLAFVMDGVFIGASWSRDMRNLMLLSGVVFVALVAVLVPVLGNHGLWVALLAFLAVRGLSLRLVLGRRVRQTFAPALT